MLPVHITVSVGRRHVALDEISDRRLASVLRDAGSSIAQRLEAIRCPVHKQIAAKVRIHFDERGGADLQYDSCCEKLGAQIGAKLG